MELKEQTRYLRAARHNDGVVYIEIGAAGVGFMNFDIEPEDAERLQEMLSQPWPKWHSALAAKTQGEK